MIALLLSLWAVAGSPAPVTWQADEGTQVLLMEDHRAPVVSVTIQFGTGRHSEWWLSSGAREVWSITTRSADDELAHRMDALSVKVTTGSGHRAKLSVSCLKSDLPRVRTLLQDVLNNEELDLRVLRRRHRQAKMGRKSNERDARWQLGHAVATTLFAEPDDPRRRNYEPSPKPITKPSQLLAARDALVRLPGRAIGLAGDLSRAEAEAFATSLLPEIDPTLPDGLDERWGALAERDAGPIDIELPKLTQVNLAWASIAPGWSHDDSVAFLVANHVLGGHFYSRLYVALRHESGQTYGVTSRASTTAVEGSWSIRTFTRNANAEQAEATLRATLHTFHEHGITQEELDQALGYLTGRQAFAHQHPSSTLGRRMNELAWGLEPGFQERQLDEAQALSLDEINAVIRRWFDPARFTMVRVLPTAKR